MSPELKSIISQLERFVPDDEDNAYPLSELLTGLESLPDRHLAIEPMFRLMERFPEADLGSPGPLVHKIEAMPDYRSQLLKSLGRCPTDLTVWMVNRILNAALSEADRRTWLEQLRLAAPDAEATATTRAAALEFLNLQGTV